MQKQFISSLSLLLFVNFLVKPLWIFGIDLQVQNTVGAEAYGLYAAIFSFVLIFNIFLDLGLSHYSNRRMAQQPEELQGNFARLSTLKFYLALLYLLIALALGYFLGYWHQAFALLLVLALNQFLQSLIVFYRSHMAGLHLFRYDAMMSVLDKVLTILFCGVVLYTDWSGAKITVLLFALLQGLALLISAGLGFVVLRRRSGPLRFRLSLDQLKVQLKASLPYALLILLMALYTRVDGVMLQQMRGEFENGIYAQAFRLLDAVNQPGYLFSVILMPLFATMLARKESVQELSRLALSLMLTLTIAVALAGATLAPWIMEALYQNHADRSTPVFQILIFSSVAFGMTYVFGTLLTAKGDLRLLNRVAVGGFLLNILLNALLIPEHGSLGAAWATVFTQFLTAVTQLYFSLRLLRFRFSGRYWLRLFLFVLAAVGTIYFSRPWLMVNLRHQGYLWIGAFAGIALLTGALAMVLGLLPWRSALKLVRERLATGENAS